MRTIVRMVANYRALRSSKHIEPTRGENAVNPAVRPRGVHRYPWPAAEHRRHGCDYRL